MAKQPIWRDIHTEPDRKVMETTMLPMAFVSYFNFIL